MIDLYAEVIINSDAVAIDKPFTYKVKVEHSEIIQVGHRVSVPFGIKNKSIEGFVVGLKCELYEKIKNIKSINAILDKDPILSRDDLKVIDFLRRNYLCKYIDAIRTIIPTGLLSGLKDKVKKVITINKELEENVSEKENYRNLYNFIKDNNGIYTRSEIFNEHNFSSYILK